MTITTLKGQVLRRNLAGKLTIPQEYFQRFFWLPPPHLDWMFKAPSQSSSKSKSKNWELTLFSSCHNHNNNNDNNNPTKIFQSSQVLRQNLAGNFITIPQEDFQRFVWFPPILIGSLKLQVKVLQSYSRSLTLKHPGLSIVYYIFALNK